LCRYGGIYERGSKEYTLDDFYSIQLDKLDRYTQLKESSVIIPAEGDDNSSGDDEEDEEDDESEDDTGDEATASDDITETHTGEVVGDNVTEDDGAEVDAKLAEKTQAEMVSLNNMRRLFVDLFHLRTRFVQKPAPSWV
jgi:hypothetical protein